jgi:hypothetical protein
MVPGIANAFKVDALHKLPASRYLHLASNGTAPLVDLD